MAPPSAVSRPIPLGTIYEFDSRKGIEQAIMKALRDMEETMIGICGMGGVGKTTMAKRIMSRVLEEHLFDEVVMVVISQQVDKLKIQLEIGESLGLKDFQEKTPQARVQKLHERLSSGTQRILLVLDDVWQPLNLKELGIPCEGNSEGCAILITSRDSNAFRAMMNVQKVFRMENLSEEDAWNLFREKVGPCVDDNRLKSTAKEVVRECRGLPLAIVAIGVSLQDEKSVGVWKDALRQLRDPNPEIYSFFMEEVYNPLIVSYYRLDNEEVKSLLLLFCLFPEGVNILVEKLLYFCMGLHIFKDIKSVEEARGRMYTLIENLKTRSFLLDGEKEDCVRMHDVVHDVCIFIAKQKGYIDGRVCTWMSTSHELIQTYLEFPNLKLLYLISYSEERGEFKMNDTLFPRMRNLEVLSIENYSWTSLPHTTQFLRNLQTLLLVSCPDLKAISVVGDLVNLEILICRDCGSIQELPPEIGRLRRLKLLELSECQQLQRIGRGVISSLVRLEELKMLKSFNQWGSEEGRERQKNALLRELKALTNLIHLEIEIKDPAIALEMMYLLPMMERFDIRIPSGFHIFPRVYNKKMHLHLEGKTCLGHWIKMQILRDTECLYLTWNGANKLGLQKNQNPLERLELEDCETVKNIVTTSMDDEGRNNADTMFLSIEYLELFSLPDLEEIWDGPISSNSFQYLKQIILEDLPALKQMWKSSWLQRNYYDEEITFPKLEFLSLKALPKVKNLFIGFESFEFPLLKVLHLVNVTQLEEIWDVDGLLIPSDSFKNLRELRLEFLPALKHLWRSRTSPYQIMIFNQLASIHIYGCHRLCNLFSLSVTASGSCLLQLKRLVIESCDMMEQVFLWNQESESHDRIGIPNLKVLILDSLPRLKSFCKGTKRVELPPLDRVKISRCPLLETQFSTYDGSSYDQDQDQDDVHNHSAHLFCKPDQECECDRYSLHEMQEKMKFKVQGIITWGNMIQECTEYMSFEGDGSRISDVEVGKSMRCLVFRECWMKMTTITVFPLLEVMWLVNIADIEEICYIDAMKNLKELRLKSLPALKHLRQSRSRSRSSSSQMNVVSIFSQLSCICIYGCRRLRYLFSLSVMATGSSCLSHLERLVIESCDTIEQVFLWNDEEEEKKKNIDIILIFPKLKFLSLISLPLLTNFCKGKKSFKFPLLVQLKISRCPLLKILVSTGGWCPENLDDGDDQPEPDKVPEYDIFQRQLAIAGKSCISHLEHLSIEECEMMEHVFLHNEEENQRNVDKTLVFSGLKFMSLKSLPRLTNLCKGIESCEFPRIGHVQLKDCPLLTTLTFDTINLFNKPNKLNMLLWKSQPFHADYLTLQGDGKRNLDSRVARNIRWLSFRECETGTKLVPVTTMDAIFPHLEVLRLVKLFKLQEIWDIDDGPIPYRSFKNLTELRLEFLPALNHLWKSSNTPSQDNAVSIFSRLSSIYIYGCHSLRNLFTLPVTASGSCTLQLKRLVIESCDMMEQVFLCNEESESHNRIHIPNLKVLILDSLPKLTSFCKGIECVELPLLDRKRISRCPSLKNFDPLCNSDDHGDDDSVHLFCKPYNKEKMEFKLQGNITLGNWIEECVEYMSSDGSRILDIGVAEIMRCLAFRECWINMTTIATVFPLLEVMWLVDITDIEEIYDIDAMKNLKELRLKSLPALKHLWQISTSTTPSHINAVSIFNQLSCIYIYGCHRLCYLFSLSVMAMGSSCLLHLERLVIEQCDMMEQVFLWDKGEEMNITLVFPKLKFLSLISLPMLTSFCKGKESFEFPLLSRMRITRCPLLVLGNFVSNDSIHLSSKPDKKKVERWINQPFGKVAYLSVEGDVDRNSSSSSSSPSQMKVGSIFHHLSSIYIYGCDKLCNLFSLSMAARGPCLLQLERLEIENCEMMEQVFLWNEESQKQRSIHVREFPKLKLLRLSFLPRLADFCRGIKRIKCPLLAKVEIVNCHKLRSSVAWNGKHSFIFNRSKSVQHQRAEHTNTAMPGTKKKGKRRLEDSTNEDI